MTKIEALAEVLSHLAATVDALQTLRPEIEPAHHTALSIAVDYVAQAARLLTHIRPVE